MGRVEELLEKLRRREIADDELMELKNALEAKMEALEKAGECEKAQKEAIILGIVRGLIQK